MVLLKAARNAKTAYSTENLAVALCSKAYEVTPFVFPIHLIPIYVAAGIGAFVHPVQCRRKEKS
jgi:hypothetical protein